jgi:ABC-type multidrug transport system fused ATPase/permease subunit
MAAHAHTHHPKSSIATWSPAPRVSSGATASLFAFYVRTLREFSRRPNRLRAFVFLVASAVHSFAHAALALAAGRCAVLLAGGVDANSSKSLRTALVLGSIGLAAAIAKAAGGVVAAHGQATMASRVGGTLRLEVLDRWFDSYRLRRPRQDDHGHSATTPGTDAPGGIATRTAARGVSVLTVRVREVETGLAVGLLGGGRALAQLVPLVAALVWISPKLAAVALLVLAPFGLLVASSRRAWKASHVAAARHAEALLEAADEAVRHADLWVAYSAETKARAAVAQLGELLGQRDARLQASAAAMSGGNEVLGALALVAALTAAAGGWLGDVGGGGRLLAFTVCFFLAYRPIRDLTEARLAWSRADLAFADLWDDGHAEASLVSADAQPAATARDWPLQDLDIDGLVLTHGAKAPITFTLRAGETVVLVGATGEGKTTLLRLLLGLDHGRAGDIRYGGTSLVEAAPGLVHRPFAWVPQDSALLTDSLDANVALAADVPTTDVRRVLALLGAERLVDATDGRRLGADGVRVSGGERQWIALARALATRQPVLLLDEPTSGLDAASQARVLDAVASLRGQRSVLLVTHRPEPLALADIIVRLRDGEVHVEPGPMSLARETTVR